MNRAREIQFQNIAFVLMLDAGAETNNGGHRYPRGDPNPVADQVLWLFPFQHAGFGGRCLIFSRTKGWAGLGIY